MQKISTFSLILEKVTLHSGIVSSVISAVAVGDSRNLTRWLWDFAGKDCKGKAVCCCMVGIVPAKTAGSSVCCFPSSVLPHTDADKTRF